MKGKKGKSFCVCTFYTNLFFKTEDNGAGFVWRFAFRIWIRNQRKIKCRSDTLPVWYPYCSYSNLHLYLSLPCIRYLLFACLFPVLCVLVFPFFFLLEILWFIVNSMIDHDANMQLLLNRIIFFVNIYLDFIISSWKFNSVSPICIVVRSKIFYKLLIFKIAGRAEGPPWHLLRPWDSWQQPSWCTGTVPVPIYTFRDRSDWTVHFDNWTWILVWDLLYRNVPV